MRIILLTQDEPFYLAENIDYLLRNLPPECKVVMCCLFEASPFGRKEGFIRKAVKTLRIFGVKFFLYYSYKYLAGRITAGKNIGHVLEKQEIEKIKIKKSINNTESISS